MRGWTISTRWLVAFVLFASYAYFYEGGGWNQNSRFDLTRAIVEQHALEIDAYHANTGDASVRDGHYYCDKAPGASLLAVPAVAGVRAIMAMAGGDPESRTSLVWQSYVATLVTAAIPGVLGALALFALARRAGASGSLAAVVSLIFGLGTPFWAYATLMWGHALAGACLIAAAYAADRLRDPSRGPREDLALGLGVGAAAGWAVCSEYPAAVPAAILSVLALLTAWRTGRGRASRVAGGLAAGAVLCAAVLMAYQNAAFGSPFHIGYADEEQRELMSAGFFGITAPHVSVMYELLFGSYRGLLPLAPVLAFAPAGMWLARRSPMRGTLIAGMAIFTFYFLMNASYAHWEGGWTYGPRHLGPALAFLCLLLVPVLQRATPKVQMVLIALAFVGVANSLAAVSTMAQPPSTVMSPMLQMIWPQFLDGQVATNLQSIFDAAWPESASPAAWNLGEKLGLIGQMSLLPLIGVYMVAGWSWPKRSAALRGPRPDRRAIRTL